MIIPDRDHQLVGRCPDWGVDCHALAAELDDWDDDPWGPILAHLVRIWHVSGHPVIPRMFRKPETGADR